MAVRQSEKGLYEKGFDEDLSEQQFERLLSLFPKQEDVTKLMFTEREKNSFVDMKRGELYPEVIGGVTRLRRVIAEVYEVDMIQSQPNFSCNGCIDTFLSYIQRLELTDSRRRGFMVATPTYFRYYHKVEALRMTLLGIPLSPNYEYPLANLLQQLKDETPSCLFLVTPNNPTGIPIPDDQLLEILDNVPEDLDVAIDRTCANIDPEISTKALLKKYPHKRIAIFHSFSKYYGLSHLRIGFTVFANQDLAAEVDRYLPFGLGLEALLKATHILSTRGELKPDERIKAFISGNQRSMKQFLLQHEDYGCSDFRSNYAVLTLPKNFSSVEFQQRLLREGIFVMPGHELPVPDERSVRIHTGGPPEYLNRMLDLIDSWR
ncbi:MAG TPA: aminotransferase class I/II-fold pyridoxal phosphate-dependent enzyme [Pyrinomonadaceae bacterium]